MPRNSSGTMVPANGPYISGTTISSVAVNARFADEEGELGDSLSRSGKGGMLAVLRGVDGTVAAPAYSYTSDTGSGWYRAGASDFRFAVGGVDVVKVTPTTIQMPAATFSALQATGTNATLGLYGNKAAADTGTDVSINSTVTRTAGKLVSVLNNGAEALSVSYQGLLALGSQAAPLQPAAMVTAITPDTNITAGGGAGFWKDATGAMHLKGQLTNNTGGLANNFVTTSPLPAGFRPLSSRLFAISPGSAAPISIQVAATGAITSPAGVANGGTIYLDGITFLAEQ